MHSPTKLQNANHRPDHRAHSFDVPRPNTKTDNQTTAGVSESSRQSGSRRNSQGEATRREMVERMSGLGLASVPSSGYGEVAQGAGAGVGVGSDLSGGHRSGVGAGTGAGSGPGEPGSPRAAGAGAGAGLYDTRLVSQTLSRGPSNGPTTYSRAGSTSHAASQRGNGNGSNSRLPLPLRSGSANSTPSSHVNVNTAPSVPMTAAASYHASANATAGPGPSSRSNSRANSMSTYSGSSGAGHGSVMGGGAGVVINADYASRYGTAAVPTAGMLRSGSAHTAATANTHSSGEALPTSAAPSYHPSPTGLGFGHNSGSGSATPGSFALHPSGAASRGSYSYSRGPSTPLVPALSLTAATPSAPGPGPINASAAGISGVRAYSPAMSAGSAGSSGAGAGSTGAGSGANSHSTSVLSASAALLQAQGEFTRNAARSIRGALEHSSPNSPWSQLTVHALPVFTGSTVKTSMENLNRLCNNHILATNQRTAQSKVSAVLITDLREFIASGMLTLKTRLEGDEGGLPERMSETWFFFWTRVLGYIEGVFLPFSKLQSTPTPASPIPRSIIPVRQLLLSGFMFHILIPSLPQLLDLLSAPDDPLQVPAHASASSIATPGTSMSETNLRRLQQMALILASQASYSSIRPLAAGQDTTTEDALAIAETVDRDVRDQLVELAGVVKWRLDQRAEAGVGAGSSLGNGQPVRPTTGLGGAEGVRTTGPSRHTSMRKRKGWRASIAPHLGMSLSGLASGHLSVQGLSRAGRQASDMTTQTHGSGQMSNQTHGHGEPSSRWGPQRGHDTEDEYPNDGAQVQGQGDAYGYEYEYDEDEEETIPAQSRNASVALDRGIGRFGHARQGSTHSQRREQGREGEGEVAGSVNTAPSTVTGTGTFRLGQPIAAGQLSGVGDEMTPTPGWGGEGMHRQGSDISGHSSAAQRA